jgi:5-methylcytosine-specific restriction endonuclease McrA
MSWSSKSTPLPRNWNTIRSRVLRNSDVCCVCHQPGADEVDHVVPRYLGGSDEAANLRPIHAFPCHASKSSAEGHARRRELAARRKRPQLKHPGRTGSV